MGKLQDSVVYLSGPIEQSKDLGVGYRKQSFRVHRLVLDAFVGPCPEGLEACHENGNRIDNRLSNLRWDTRSNNHQDKLKHGTDHRGSKNPQAKLSEEQVGEIKRLLGQGVKQVDIARRFNIHKGTVHDIKKGHNWGWLDE